MTKLEKSFSIYAYLHSDTAEKMIKAGKLTKNEQYDPPVNVISSLQYLHNNITLKALNSLPGDLYVDSGFRCDKLNTALKGSNTSQHMKGEAADITSTDNAELFRLIRDNFTFDQLIWEDGDDSAPAWIHVSYKKHGNRKEVLKMRNGKYFKM